MPRSTRTRALIALVVLTAAGALAAVLPRTPGPVGPRATYLALGDSVAYGFPPSFDVSHGYAEALFGELRPFGTEQLVNMACPGESSGSMLRGGCRFVLIAKSPYPGAQTDAAVAYIAANRGRVSPVTLTIGANDVIQALGANCAQDVAAFRARLVDFDRNFDRITSRLATALDGTGDLVVTTYYNPYQDACPNSTRYLRALNARIAAIATRHGARVVDVLPTFAGRACEYTWMCSRYRDIHPTTAGHQAIADRIADRVLGTTRRVSTVALRDALCKALGEAPGCVPGSANMPARIVIPRRDSSPCITPPGQQRPICSER